MFHRLTEYIFFFSILLVCAGAAWAQPQPVITTVAGTDFLDNADHAPAVNVPFGSVFGIAADARGNVYAAAGSRIVRINPDGILDVVAGNGLAGYSGDNGPAAMHLYYFQTVWHWTVRVPSTFHNSIQIGAPDSTGWDYCAFRNQGNRSNQFKRWRSCDYSVGNVYLADQNRVIRQSPGGKIEVIAGMARIVDSGPPALRWMGGLPRRSPPGLRHSRR